MTDIEITDLNAAFIQINAEPSIMKELEEEFTFLAPNYQYDPRYKRRVWDGRIRLINARGMVYAGLKWKMEKWAIEHHYSVNALPQPSASIWREPFEPVKTPFEPRPYQLDICGRCVANLRAVVVSPTASGKSWMIYQLVRYYNKKTLVIVPTINLVEQMNKDFRTYGYDKPIGVKYYSADRAAGGGSRADIMISTWQSLVDLPKEYFEQFEVVIGDECHGFKAKSLIHIMSQLTNAHFRFGFTATLSNDIMCHELALEGLFGPIIRGETTKQLQDQGHLADLEIITLVLEYPEEDRKKAKGMTFNEETDFLVAHEGRQHFINSLSTNLSGSTFVLFRLVDKHGKPLFDKLTATAPDRVRFVYGGVDGSEREEIRIDANENDIIVVASYGVFSGGVNVPNLKNVVFASPYKSKIKVMQSIGRGLRRTKDKDKAYIYDVVDNLSIGSHNNYGIKHYIDRVKLYCKERFSYKIYNIPIKNKKEESILNDEKDQELRQ